MTFTKHNFNYYLIYKNNTNKRESGKIMLIFLSKNYETVVQNLFLKLYTYITINSSVKYQIFMFLVYRLKRSFWSLTFIMTKSMKKYFFCYYRNTGLSDYADLFSNRDRCSPNSINMHGLLQGIPANIIDYQPCFSRQ